jgi:hypothetical protein
MVAMSLKYLSRKAALVVATWTPIVLPLSWPRQVSMIFFAWSGWLVRL